MDKKERKDIVDKLENKNKKWLIRNTELTKVSFFLIKSLHIIQKS